MIRLTEAEFAALMEKRGGMKRKIRAPRCDKHADALALQCAVHGLPTPQREFRFHPTRRWRIDLAFPDCRLAVEVDGQVHRIRSRFDGDIEKHQALLAHGWRLLRVSTHQVRSGEAVALIVDAFQLVKGA